MARWKYLKPGYWLRVGNRYRWNAVKAARAIGCGTETVRRYWNKHIPDWRDRHRRLHGLCPFADRIKIKQHQINHPAEFEALIIEHKGDMKAVANHLGIHYSMAVRISNELGIDQAQYRPANRHLWHKFANNFCGVRKLREITGDDGLLSIEDIREKELSTDGPEHWASQILGG